MTHSGRTIAEPETKLSETWHKIVGKVVVHYHPPCWVYDGATKRNIYREGFFYSYIWYDNLQK